MSYNVSCLDSDRQTMISYDARYKPSNSRVWINQVNNPDLVTQFGDSISSKFDADFSTINDNMRPVAPSFGGMPS